MHRGEFCFATEGNVVNPRIGSDLQYGRGVEEEKTAEVVENHGGGTRMGLASHPEGGPAAADTQ